MNYIMGFLFLFFNNEEDTFKFYVNLVEKRLYSIFSLNYEKLKLHFYLLDRLLEIYCPEIH